MNQDILFVVAGFSDRATLGSICRVSQATQRAASRQLYRAVRLRSCDELAAVQGALARNTRLLPHIVNFVFDTSFDELTKLNFIARRHAALRVRAFINDVLPKLANLEALAFDCDTLVPDLPALLAESLVVLLRLRGVKLPAVMANNLRALGTSGITLEHLSISHRQDGLYNLLSELVATLRTLHVTACGALIAQLSQNNTVFPRLHTLALSGSIIKLTARCARGFPAVRSLADHRPFPGAADAWPLLEHLDAFMHDVAAADRARPYGPAVRKLRLIYQGPHALDLDRLSHWTSPQITALALAFLNGGFAAHAAALGAFSGLCMLDVTLLGDLSDTDTDVWLYQAASSLSAVPSHLEVLTLRAATGLHEPQANPLDAMRRSVPTLRLLRIILQRPPQRLSFAQPKPVDWLTACEIVADYLPHWGEIRAPWDDIRDICALRSSLASRL